MTIKKRQQQKKLESNCQTYDTSYKTKLTAMNYEVNSSINQMLKYKIRERNIDIEERKQKKKIY